MSNGGSSRHEHPSSSQGSGSSSEHRRKPAKVLHGLKGVKGKSYEEKSKNLPNVVEF